MNKLPFPITESRAKKSPLKNIKKVEEILNDYNNGIDIGFSRISTLKSMGLIPRNNGFYELGQKYK